MRERVDEAFYDIAWCVWRGLVVTYLPAYIYSLSHDNLCVFFLCYLRILNISVVEWFFFSMWHWLATISFNSVPWHYFRACDVITCACLLVVLEYFWRMNWEEYMTIICCGEYMVLLSSKLWLNSTMRWRLW